MTKFTLENIVWKEDKFYVAQCLNVEVSSFGKTKNEALTNLDEALDLYFEDQSIQSLKKVTKIERPQLVSMSYVHA